MKLQSLPAVSTYSTYILPYELNLHLYLCSTTFPVHVPTSHTITVTTTTLLPPQTALSTSAHQDSSQIKEKVGWRVVFSCHSLVTKGRTFEERKLDLELTCVRCFMRKCNFFMKCEDTIKYIYDMCTALQGVLAGLLC